jgi:outer membrane lipoprotein-sorting protein
MTRTLFSSQFGKMSAPSEPDEDVEETPQAIAYLGTETVAGFKCHTIKVTLSYGGEETLWIDMKEGSLIKAETSTDGEKILTLNRNFKKVKGSLLPHVTQTYEDGVLAGTSTITKIETDPTLKESLFDPAGVKGYEKETSTPDGPRFTDPTQMMGQMMQMGMEIERLTREGKTEEAAALQKKMEAMAAGMKAH